MAGSMQLTKACLHLMTSGVLASSAFLSSRILMKRGNLQKEDFCIIVPPPNAFPGPKAVRVAGTQKCRHSHITHLQQSKCSTLDRSPQIGGASNSSKICSTKCSLIPSSPKGRSGKEGEAHWM